MRIILTYRRSALRFLLLLFIVMPAKLIAQDISGVWKGVISTTDKEVPYELAISEADGRLTGYSYTRFNVNGKEMVAVKSIKVENNNGRVTVADDDLIYDNFSQSAARSVRQTSNLVLTIEGTLMTMTGEFKTRKTREFRTLTGKITLQKQDSIRETAIAPKLDSLNLLKDLSFVKPKTVVPEPLVIAPVTEPRMPKRPIQKPPSPTYTTIVKPTLQATTGSRKIIPEPVEVPPVIAVVVPPVQKPVPKPVIVAAAKPPVTATPKPTPVTTTPKPTPAIVTAPPVAKPAIVRSTVTGPDFTASLAKRSIETIKTLEFKTDSLLLTLYDNGEVDGDTVSVVLNGKMLMAKQGLSTNAITKTIYITPDMGDSLQLVMYAENLGSLPPNTGLLIIKDGNDRYEIRFAGDLNKNAGITLRRKK